MPLEDVCMLPDRDRVEHVLYHALSAGFDSLGDMFLTHLRCIQNKHQKDCNIVYCLLENPGLRPLHLMLHKDQRFYMYIVKYSWKKIKKEIDKLISSPQFRKQAADISLESFETFLYIDVNRKHRRHAPFTQALFCIYVDSLDVIMNDPDVMGDKDVFLRNNIIKLSLLEDQTSSQHNHALVAVVVLSMLCYI